ncbi:hypothetical protein G3M48_007923 [Beauveria asiatica]|uniref:Uncharacterized protein n=1 Tax=Beauveria asiatica TaxID=1069075 RepID=A0AAW0RLX3_9HYPO
MAESWPAPNLRTGAANPTPKTAAGEEAAAVEMSSSFYLVPFQGQVTSRGTINLLLCELSDLDQRLSDLMKHIEETICIFENELSPDTPSAPTSPQAPWAGTEPTQNAEPQYGTGNPTSRGSRREKKGCSRAQSRVQKKSASVSRRQAYAFERLRAARQATGGIIEYQGYWEPTWLPIEHLQGSDAVQEAKDWVIAVFGSFTWHKEARKLGLIYEHGRE